MAWKPGDIVVAFHEEFPSNFYPWKRLESRAWKSAGSPFRRSRSHRPGLQRRADARRELCPYLSGYRVNLETSAKSAPAAAVSSWSTPSRGWRFPHRRRAAQIGALAADGHKWLLGPEGCGVLYVRKEFQDDIEPIEFGWTNVAKYYDYSSRDMTLRSDAGRYECGTLNTIGCYGLRAALDFLLEVGIENTQSDSGSGRPNPSRRHRYRA